MPNEETEIITEEITSSAAPAETETQEETTTTVDDTTQAPASGDEPTEDEGVDYKAELERVQTQLGQAEFTIEKLKKKPATAPVEDDEDEDEEPTVPQSTATPDVEEIVKQQVAQHMTGIVADTIDDIATSMTGNEDERKLMMIYYDKKIQKSGFTRAQIREDLALALAMANSPKIVRENSELKRTVRTKKTIVNTSTGQNQDRHEPVEAPAVGFSEADRIVMEHYNVKPEDVKSTGVVS